MACLQRGMYTSLLPVLAGGGATTVQAVTRCVMSKVIPTGMLLITDIRGRHDASQEEADYKENGPFWISNEVKRQEGAAVDATTQR